MLKKLKLYLRLAWLMLTQGDSIKQLDIRQQISVSSFQKAVEDLQKVHDAYADRADEYAKESQIHRDLAEKTSKMSEVSYAKSVHTGTKINKLKKLID